MGAAPISPGPTPARNAGARRTCRAAGALAGDEDPRLSRSRHRRRRGPGRCPQTRERFGGNLARPGSGRLRRPRGPSHLHRWAGPRHSRRTSSTVQEDRPPASSRTVNTPCAARRQDDHRDARPYLAVQRSGIQDHPATGNLSDMRSGYCQIVDTNCPLLSRRCLSSGRGAADRLRDTGHRRQLPGVIALLRNAVATDKPRLRRPRPSYPPLRHLHPWRAPTAQRQQTPQAGVVPTRLSVSSLRHGEPGLLRPQNGVRASGTTPPSSASPDAAPMSSTPRSRTRPATRPACPKRLDSGHRDAPRSS